MEFISHLALGFSIAFTAQNLLYVLMGCLLGSVIGVLPGIGPLATMAMVLPATYALAPVSALILLAGIYYGAQYGGATAAILVNLPAGASSTATAVDGYQMARNGRAAPALAAAGLGSFVAGCLGTLLLALLAAPLTELAAQCGSAEYFSLMVLGLVGSVVMAPGSLIKAIAMALLGLLLGMVGLDAISGVARFSLRPQGVPDGMRFIVIAMGVFAYGEIIHRLAKNEGPRQVLAASVKGWWPGRDDFRQMLPAIFRGTALGSLLGMLPGGGAVLAAFAAHTLEKRTPLHPGEEAVGTGNIRGVAAPEAANNAGAQTAFVPLLTLGIPPNAVMALMVGAMTLHHIQPGPQLMGEHPDFFWGLIVSMWLGNAMLGALNLPLMAVWVRLLRVPYRWLFPLVVLFCAMGVYSITHVGVDIWLVGLFGVIGYVFIQLGMEPAPLLLGFVLGPMMEGSLREALLSSQGNWGVFLIRPLSASLLGVAALLVVLALMPSVKSKREEAFVED